MASEALFEVRENVMEKRLKEEIEQLTAGRFPNEKEAYGAFIRDLSEGVRKEERAYLFENSRERARTVYGNKIYIRGLIEISNICKNNCYYCGIRKDNRKIERYRLDAETIRACCRYGYEKGFRTFVLQGGEDPGLTDAVVTDLIRQIREEFPDCAITLSLGEWERESYQHFFDAGADRYLLRHETAEKWHYEKIHPPFPDCAITLSLGEWERESYQHFFDAGADRYLLRHETAEKWHYEKIHPPELFWEHRRKCLENLKEIGYQTGCGCMVGSPFQTPEHLGADLVYMKELQPHMVGIGPFISQKDTPFRKYPNGTLNQTLVLLAMIRLLLPQVLLPATTALGTIHPRGRELGILAGANVVMPNLSPRENRKKYLLYDDKLGTGEESGEGVELLRRQMEQIGYEVVTDRGDYPKKERG